MFPKKLKKGSHLRVIAPSRSLTTISIAGRAYALKKLQSYGFEVSFGKHVEENDDYNSSSIESRLEDIHEAFRDDSVDGILTAIGGYNSNQLLKYLDYELIRNNPKILCGFSDITVLSHAIFAKTGLVTYSGPHFSSWSMKKGFEYSEEYFKKALMYDKPYLIKSSQTWSDDPWYLDQENRVFIQNEGYWVLNEGKAKGRLIGAHVRCLSALQGTEFWPGFKDSLLFMEEDAETTPTIFDRLLQSFIHLPDFKNIQAIVIGRFQKESGMTKKIIGQIVDSKKELKNIPIVANANFGHTTPAITFPIGGEIILEAEQKIVKLEILKH
ncbi:MAG: LD-carboxypeptidase [bacterium]|nr:LD-carboxypeptidase [bacterium]